MKAGSAVLVLIAASLQPSYAADPGELGSGIASFGNGVSAHIVTKAEPPERVPALKFGNSYQIGDGILHRSVTDAVNHTYFGYDLRVDPAVDSGRCRVAILPLSRVVMQPTATAASSAATARPGSTQYILGPNDVLAVTVFDSKNVPGTYTIGPDGRIALPLLGAFKVSDMTIPELKDLLTRKLRDEGGIPEPIVNVQLLRSNSITPWRIVLLPKYPSPQVVSDGDTVALDLLATANGQQKVVDYIEITCKTRGNPAAAAISDASLDDLQLALTEPGVYVNGTLISGPAKGVRQNGNLVWFYLQGRGRFILSLVPRQDFVRAGTVHDNVISVAFGATQYEIRNSATVFGSGRLCNLYVLNEPSFEAKPSPSFGRITQ